MSYLIAMDTDFGLIGSKRFRSNPTPSVDEAKAFWNWRSDEAKEHIRSHFPEEYAKIQERLKEEAEHAASLKA